MENLDNIRDKHFRKVVKVIDDFGRMPAAQGNEGSRYNFTFDHYQHPKGLWFRWFVKPLIEKTIKYLHAKILKKYSAQAFEFQDPRLFYFKKFCQDFFKINLNVRKQDLAEQTLDIALWLLKEDIFYRVRWITFINEFVTWYRANNTWGANRVLFGLDEPEKENLVKYNMPEHRDS